MNLSTRPFASIMRELASRPIRFFVITSLVFGAAFIILVPPFQNPDEFTHFIRAYEVSELKTPHREHHRGEVDQKGSKLPNSILLTYKKTRLYHPPGTLDVPQSKKYFLSQTQASLKIPLDKSVTSFYNTGTSSAYFPLLYAPQAAIIKVLSIVEAPVIAMLYATRLTGLLAWVLLAIIALRIMRPTKHRLAIAGVLILPMFIAQTAAPNVEAILTGSTVLYLALITNVIATKKTLTTKKLVILLGLLTIMVMTKPVCIAFGILLLLARAKWRGLKGFVFKATCIAIPLIFYASWAIATRDTGGPVYDNSVAISRAVPSLQVDYLVPNIFNFFQPFVNTLLLGWGDGVYTSLIGTFGKLDTPLPLIFVALGYVLVLIAAFSTYKDDNIDVTLDKKTKYLTPLVVLAATIYVIGVYLSMYIFSTPPRAKIVTGVQGRYLLPILPLLVLFMPKVFITSRKVYASICLLVPITLLLVAVVVIWLRYYLNYPS